MPENIINIVLGIFLTALLGAFFASFIPRTLNERAKFIDAGNELRKSFATTIADLNSNRIVKYSNVIDWVPIITNEIKSQQIAIVNFSHFLKGKRLARYTEACNEYKNNCEALSSDFGDELYRIKLLNNIEDIIKFTKHV